MNLLILEAGEAGSLLPPSDRRHAHLRRILKKGPGDEVEAGLATDEAFGPVPDSLGLARIERLDPSGLVLSYRGLREAPPLSPLRLVLGFPRPIQAGRILKDLTSLGLFRLELTGTALGEKSYLESTFFRDGEYRHHLLEGAEQAANPRLPGVGLHWTLPRCLGTLGPPASGELRLALHPGPEAPDLGRLLADRRARSDRLGDTLPLTLAVGSERGWTPGEVDLLREAGFLVCGLGRRILKTETAALVASGLLLSALGRL